ncbi:Hypothetical protein PHPALM_6582 [Phytophthora palmivora]|uniref:PiggyBac transposable element-derived protein domain-containing protein n=1 Tax=Phytophthora palmivora TaxID=4796 RepID=A0A2P4YEI0_9STRA|nr:Hypothetical protein PHPALM_6582 [Phytophthora palmivora]
MTTNKSSNDDHIYVKTLARNEGITAKGTGYTTTMAKPSLIQSGVPIVSLREFNAYIGLEIATSICSLNRLRNYWSTNDLYGHPLFCSTMQRDLFLGMRAALTLRPIDTVPEELNSKKTRSAERTYIASKPDKYSVRFYALVDWKTLYVYGLFDSGSDNSTVPGHLERYTAVFPELRRSLAASNSGAKSAAQGSWKLVAAIDTADNLRDLEKVNKQSQKHLKKVQKTPFVSPRHRSPHAGYIAFCDKKIMLFYTNDLAATPSANVLDGRTLGHVSSDEAFCVCSSVRIHLFYECS